MSLPNIVRGPWDLSIVLLCLSTSLALALVWLLDAPGPAVAVHLTGALLAWPDVTDAGLRWYRRRQRAAASVKTTGTNARQ